MLILLILIVLIVAADQLTKWLAVIYLKNAMPAEVIPGILRFTYLENDGAAFGMLDNHRWIFMVLSTLAIAALLIFLWRWPPRSLLCRISIAFLIGGGIGNMIDRCLLGYVIDFIDFCAFPEIWKYIFNVADAFVTVGTGMLMFYLIREMILDSKREKNAAGEPKPVTEETPTDTPETATESEAEAAESRATEDTDGENGDANDGRTD